MTTDLLDTILWSYAVARPRVPYSGDRVFRAAELWLLERIAEDQHTPERGALPLSLLSNILWSYAATMRRAPALFDAANALLHSRQEDVPRRIAESLAWSYSRLGLVPPAPLLNRLHATVGESDGLERSRDWK